ncbi:membrane protein [Faunimonas pinastri]|uniref:Membrane protein n=1 Tax=Faunimonas pinastri TaxID=1855383 RepID=A0A1H9LU77_9HYPH|nr:YihY/virulence factor BrkB family protein [Faunimonas pinastri]SER15021.1 membrane protein [Faunimonas pinastri]
MAGADQTSVPVQKAAPALRVGAGLLEALGLTTLIVAAVSSFQSVARRSPAEGAETSGAFPRADDLARVQQKQHGRAALAPHQIPFKGWKDIFWRLVSEISKDNVSLVAAGSTFFLLLALFPAIGALVSIYGLFANPAAIQDNLDRLRGVLPAGGIDIIREQLKTLISQSDTAHGVTFLIGLATALWSANSGIKTLFMALNVAYEEEERRSFIRLNLVSAGFTIGALALGIIFLFAIAAVPAIAAWAGPYDASAIILKHGRWPAIMIIAIVSISILYRYGPSRRRPHWKWVWWGSTFAAIAWLLTSALFSWYLSSFADYNKTYGSLGAAIGFMMWTWISMIIFIVGAELNSEIEHQTAQDTTVGAPKPMGLRGATMADTLGRAADEPTPPQATPPPGSAVPE